MRRPAPRGRQHVPVMRRWLVAAVIAGFLPALISATTSAVEPAAGDGLELYECDHAEADRWQRVPVAASPGKFLLRLLSDAANVGDHV